MIWQQNIIKFYILYENYYTSYLLYSFNLSNSFLSGMQLWFNSKKMILPSIFLSLNNPDTLEILVKLISRNYRYREYITIKIGFSIFGHLTIKY